MILKSTRIKLSLIFISICLFIPTLQAQKSSIKWWNNYELILSKNKSDIEVQNYLTTRKFYIVRGLNQYITKYFSLKESSSQKTKLKQIINKTAYYIDKIYITNQLKHYTAQMLKLNSNQINVLNSAQSDLNLSWKNTPRHNFKYALEMGYSAYEKNKSVGNIIGQIWSLNSIATLHNAIVFYKDPRKNISKETELEMALKHFKIAEKLAKNIHLPIEETEAAYGEFMVLKSFGKRNKAKKISNKLIKMHQKLPNQVEWKNKHLRFLRKI